MNNYKKSLIIGISILGLSNLALAEDHCFDYYVETAKQTRVSKPAEVVGLGSTLGGTTGAFAGTSSGGVAAVAILGGTTVNSIAEGYSAEALFASNIAQTMIEAKAGVVGPYSTQMANDLNDAITDSGKFKPEVKGTSISYSSPLSDEVKAQLRNRLGGQKITPEQISEATQQLLKIGGFCSVTGEILSQNEWASLMVSSQ